MEPWRFSRMVTNGYHQLLEDDGDEDPDEAESEETMIGDEDGLEGAHVHVSGL